jgi:heparan-alpha-glucosaminide N-acetyltransferase
MIWVNYIAGMPGIPYWLEHAGPRADGITVPDLVFPAFLFIVGIAIPLALHREHGRFSALLVGRLLWRAGSLMVAGVVLANAYRYDASAALLPRAVYFLLFYVAMILLWRQSAQRGAVFWAGLALMLFLLLSFRGQLNAEFSSVYLQHTWWGILGMIGWAYLLCSAIYVALDGKPLLLLAALVLLIMLYLAGTAGVLPLPQALNGFVNVPQVLGSTSANVLAGTVAGTLFLRRTQPDTVALAAPALAAPEHHAVLHRRRVLLMACFALALFGAGMLLRPLHGINKIQATESYTLVCSGLVLALFMVFYVLIDVLQWRWWSVPLMPAGANALFAFIAPDLWEQLAAVLRMPRWWWPYLESGGGAGLLNAAALAVAMMGLTALANRAGLRLKF